MTSAEARQRRQRLTDLLWDVYLHRRAPSAALTDIECLLDARAQEAKEAFKRDSQAWVELTGVEPREAPEGVLTAVLREVAERVRPDNTPEGVLAAMEGIARLGIGDIRIEWAAPKTRLGHAFSLERRDFKGRHGPFYYHEYFRSGEPIGERDLLNHDEAAALIAQRMGGNDGKR